VQAAARNAGQAWRTVERAKAKLKISTGNRVDGWPWSLPQDQLCHGEKRLHPKTLAELADIKKVNAAPPEEERWSGGQGNKNC
jgi:hypothetical protein